MECFRIGVAPAHAMQQASGLLDALALAFPVAFEGRAIDELDGLDGLLVLDCAAAGELPDATRLPAGLQALVAPLAGSASPSAAVRFSGDARVERALRGRQLIDEGSRGRVPVACGGRDTVLASADGQPVWWRASHAGLQVSVCAVAALQHDQTLREHLRPGRFMGLVPLIHLLRDVCEGVDRRQRTLQASFVIDDPNLHRSRYGYLDYTQLVGHAREHGYHVGLGMVPLDGWMTSRRAASLVRANGASLSLLVHGNDHVARELGRLSNDRDAEQVVAQALRRTAAFERRCGVAVRRVMVPPHGACSEQALRAMLRLGFEAACVSRPHPWRDGLPAPSPLSGWRPAELVAGGLPILPRHHLHGAREELVFRALLGQPLILYGHHWDFAQGLDVLAQAAQDVNGLGDVRWRALDELALRNCWAHRRGGELTVELCSRRVCIDVASPVTTLRVHTGEVHGGPLWRGVSCASADAASSPAVFSGVLPDDTDIDGASSPAACVPMAKRPGGWESDLIAVRPPARIELSLVPEHPLAADAHGGRSPRPWPLARRLLVEGRDRVRPLLGGRAAG